MAPNPTRIISCRAWNSLVQYPSRECKHEIKVFEGNVFHPIFRENVQGRKHPGSCAFAEQELLSYRKPKRVVENGKDGHKNPNDSHNYLDENHDKLIKELAKGAHNDT